MAALLGLSLAGNTGMAQAQSNSSARAAVTTAGSSAAPKLNADLYYEGFSFHNSIMDAYLIQQQPNGKTVRLADLGDPTWTYEATAFTPAISTSGRQIAFVMVDCYIPGSVNSCTSDAGDSDAVVVMNTDGGDERAVSRVGVGGTAVVDSPRWSRDGKWIYFGEDDSHAGIFRVHPDGSGQVAVTNFPAHSDYMEGFSLSPDGTRIAYDDGQFYYHNGQLYIANVDGSGETKVHNQPTGSHASNTDPVWTPNGKTLVFTSGNDSANTWSIYRINIDGTGLTRLTSGLTYRPSIAVSLDGKTVAFDGTGGIDSVPMSGSRVETVIAHPPAGSGEFLAYGPVIAQPTKTIVALGDSVAAGEGINYGFVWDNTHREWVQHGPKNPSWRNTTASLGRNYQDCHQSGRAYADLLSGRKYKVYNMACTGAAAIGGVLTKYAIAPAELGGACHGCAAPNKLYDQHDPDVVTLTIGADDIDFAHWVGACYSPGPACNTKANTKRLAGQLSTEKANLRLVLGELNRRAGLHKKKVLVVVTNYYDPYQAKYVKCIDTSGIGPVGITSAKQAWIVSGLGKLNANIAAEVKYAQAHDPRLTVRLSDISKVMAGHQLCTANPRVYGPSIAYSITSSPAPMHPTPAGQVAIREVVAATIAR
jgi:Lipoprotein LpqB beta-propeller domain/GDSL-like Lipase/Acylhydrolase family